MRTILGAVIGAVVVGVLMIAYGGTPRAMSDRVQLAPSAIDGVEARMVSDPAAAARQTPSPTANDMTTVGRSVMVKCEPNQQAIVRESLVNGELMRHIECVGPVASSAVSVDPYDRSVMPASQAMVTTTTPPRAVRAVSYEEPIVTREPSRRRPEPRASTRSWKKSALIIGGSTGAAAGVGGLAGGKKGALIGAAIGGGAATLYEALKR